jgi:hypothetical protein
MDREDSTLASGRDLASSLPATAMRCRSEVRKSSSTLPDGRTQTLFNLGGIS